MNTVSYKPPLMPNAAAPAACGASGSSQELTPFFELFESAKLPYAAPAVVYTRAHNGAKRYYFLLCGPEYTAPGVKGSKWVEFTPETFISSMQFFLDTDCTFQMERTSSNDDDPLCLPNHKKFWKQGTVRCHDGAVYYNTVDTVTDPPSADWVGGTTTQRMLQFLVDQTS